MPVRLVFRHREKRGNPVTARGPACVGFASNGEDDAKLGAEGVTSACTAVLYECTCVSGQIFFLVF